MNDEDDNLDADMEDGPENTPSAVELAARALLALNANQSRAEAEGTFTALLDSSNSDGDVEMGEVDDESVLAFDELLNMDMRIRMLEAYASNNPGATDEEAYWAIEEAIFAIDLEMAVEEIIDVPLGSFGLFEGVLIGSMSFQHVLHQLACC